MEVTPLKPFVLSTFIIRYLGTLLMIYRAFIRARIDFGNYIYESCRSYYLNHINVLENEALRLCLGACRTTPISSLYSEASEISFHFRCIKAGLANAVKILSKPQNPCYNAMRIPSYSGLFSLHSRSIKQTLGLCLPLHFEEANIVPSSIAKFIIPAVPPWKLKVPTVYLTLSAFVKSHHKP